MSVQPGFFDVERRYEKLGKTRDFLRRVNRFVSWGKFSPDARGGTETLAAREGRQASV